MKQHKKVWCIATAVILLLTLVGCSAANNSTLPSETISEETHPSESTQPQTTETAIHTHEWVSAVIAPDCTENGYTYHTCTGCDDTYTDDETEAIGHKYSMEITLEPTCTDDGIKTFTCENCAATYDEVIVALGHNYVSVVTKPTCENNGFTTHSCTGCSDSYVDSETNPAGHNYVGNITNSATCTEDGIEIFTCESCGDAYSKEVPMIGHKYAATVVEASCENVGFTQYVCSNCEDCYIDEEVNAIGHKYVSEVTKEATCEESGVRTFTCERCDDVYTETIKAIGHQYDPVVIPPTCLDDGYTIYTCSNCGTTHLADKVAALGHNYFSKITKTPTCVEYGVEVLVCDVCDDSYEKNIDRIAHSYSSEAMNPTCETNGYTRHVCSACGNEYTDSEREATGHNYVSQITSEATCVDDGVKTFTCDNCDDTYTEGITAAGHEYATTVTEPSCEKDGFTVYTCKICNESYTDAVTNATGHNYTSEITNAPTCDNTGIKTFACKNCDDSYTEVIPAVGHIYASEVVTPTCINDGYTLYTCSACGNSYVDNEVLASGHSWGDWVVTKEADENVEGTQERICNTCGKTEIEIIPELHYHSFVVTSQTKATCTENGVIYRACACGATNYTTVEEALGHDWERRGQAEVGRYEGYIFCHCGNWNCPTADVRYDLAFMDHIDEDHNGEWWDWSYYGRNVWVVDIPANEWLECTVCNLIK